MPQKGSKDSPEVDTRIWEIIHEYLLGVSNDGSDLREPHLRPSLVHTYKFVLFAFSLLVAVGLVANLIVFYSIIKNKRYKDATQAFMLNMVICDVVKCLFVLPLSVYVLLIQNWVLGELMCSFLPMIQDIPIHVTTLTFTMMAWDRLRFLRNPNRLRLPAFVCCFGTWLTAMCLVMPYPLYIIYVDLGNYVAELDDVGICIYNLVDDMEEYMRGTFLTAYVVPMCVVSFMYIRASQEIKNRQNALTKKRVHISADSYVYGHRLLQRDIKCRTDSIITRSDEEVENIPRRLSNLDLLQEKRNQNFLVFIATVYGICLCPIMVMRLVRFAVVETYDNSKVLDILYTLFVWIAFTPVCITPLSYIVWQSPNSTNKKHSCETINILESDISESFPKRFGSDLKQLTSTCSSSLIEGSNG